MTVKLKATVRTPRLIKKALSALSCLLLTSSAIMPVAQAQSFNLSSTHDSMTAPNTQPVTVRIGGVLRTVQPGQAVTPAEFVALNQVVAGGRQTLVVGSNGAATSGLFSIGKDLGSTVSGVSIPQGVSAIGSSNHNFNLDISGAVSNAGRLFMVPSQMSFSAVDIFNTRTGSISTQLPAALSALLHSPTIADVRLTASNSINNAGLIFGTGSVILNSPNVVNSGIIEAKTGNIYFETNTPSNIAVDNSGGTLKALAGDVNVRTSAFTAPYNFDIRGGDIFSNKFNIWSGKGSVNVDVNNVSSLTNVTACIAHINANTANLNLGVMDISGDPTFYNGGGDITINSGISTAGADLAILAKGNILSTNAGSITTGGGNATLIAGAKFTPTAGGGTDTNGQSTGSTSTFTVTGASTLGGRIDLSNLGAPVDTTSTTANGGNVTLVAFAGQASRSGKISTGGVTVQTYTTDSGSTSGNVVMLAGAHSGSGITAGPIATFSSGTPSASDGGQVLLATAVPSVGSGISITDGTVAGSITADKTQSSSITTQSIATFSAPITMITGGSVGLGGDITTNGSTAGGSRPGGNVTIMAGRGIATTSNGININTSGNTNNTNGGNVLMVAGARLGSTSITVDPATTTVSASTTVTGPSARGGSIDLTGGGANNIASLTTEADAATSGANAGSVQLIAFRGTLPSTANGSVTLPTGVAIQTSGDNTATAANTNINGDVTIMAGSASGQSITTGDITTAGGYASGGRITVVTAQATAGLPFSYASEEGNSSATITGSFDAGKLEKASAVVGNLTATAGTDNTETLAVTVKAGKDLTVGSVTNNTNVSSNGNTPVSSITLTAGGVMTFASGAAITSTPFEATTTSNANGGTIYLQAKSFDFSQSGGTVAVNANGVYDASDTTTTNHGGQITIESTGTSANSTVQIGEGNFQLSAIAGGVGGNGGTISVSSGSDITVVPQDSSSNLYLTVAAQSNDADQSTGNGGTISLTAAAGNVLIQACATCTDAQGGLDASGAPSTLDSTGTNGGFAGGNGGTISITTNSSTAFSVYASAGISTNGSQGPLTANGNAVNSCSNCVNASGNGGTIIIRNLGTGGIVVNNQQPVATVIPGIQVIAGDSQTVPGPNPPALPNADNYFQAGIGGSITLEAKGAGGQVQIIGPGSTAGNLDASGGQNSTNLPGGTGGTITIVTNSSNNFGLGTLTSNNGAGLLTAVGNNGTTSTFAAPTYLLPPGLGDGGHISITNLGSGGIFIAASSAPSVAAQTAQDGVFFGGNGGSISLNAPSGPVLSLASLDVSGGNGSGASPNDNPDGGYGGSITIVSNSSLHAFAVGTTAGNGGPSNTTAGVGNGVMGTITAFGFIGGSISITNSGSAGVRIGTGLTGYSSPAAISVDTFVVPNPPAVSYYSGGGGSISLLAPQGTVNIQAALNANGGENFNNGGNGGSIYILTNSSSPFLVNQTLSTTNPNGSSSTLSANGTVGAAFNGSGGSITIINNGGSINIAQGGISALAPPSLPNPLQTAGASPGTGGSITLMAPKSTVLVSDNVIADGGYGNSPASPPSGNTGGYQSGYGGSISIICNSSSPFRVGTGSDAPDSKNNGVAGLVSASGFFGGSVSIVNLGTGGIRIGQTTYSPTGYTGIAVLASAIDNVGTSTAGGNGGSITLRAPTGPVGVLGTLDVSGVANINTVTTSTYGYGGVVGGSGGTISITTGSSATFVIDPQPASIGGSTTVNGIIGKLFAKGANAQNDSTVGGTSSALTVGDGGSISVVALKGGIAVATANAVSVAVPQATNPNGDAYAGNGGSISLQASNGAVKITGGLSADGGQTTDTNTNPGFGGSISISAKSTGTNPFNVGGATVAKPDGTTAAITASGWSGGQISITNYGSGGITIGTGMLTANAASANANAGTGGGPGGSITLQAPKGPVFIPGGLQVNGGGDATATATLSSTLSAGILQSATVNSVTGFALYQYVLITDGTNFEREAIDSIDVGTSTITIGQVINTYNSGSITAYNPGGNGGQISILCNSSKPFIVGSPTANGAASLSARGANGGSITITNAGGSIQVANPANMNAKPRTPGNTTFVNANQTTSTGGNGAQYYLNALGKGGIVYVGQNSSGISLDASGGAAYSGAAVKQQGNPGVIAITSNATSAFIIGGAASNTNGTAGTLSATGLSGGSIGVKNIGKGGISFNTANISVTAASGNGGNIDLEAPVGPISSLSGGTLSASAIGDGYTGGTITLQMASLNLNSQALTLSASADPDSNTAANGGTISIKQTAGVLSLGSANLLILEANGAGSGQGGNFILNSPGGIAVSGGLSTGTTGTITMSVSGKGTITSGTNNPIITGELALFTGAGTGTSVVNITTQVALLQLTSGGNNVTVNNTGTSAMSIGQISQFGAGTISITANSPLSVNEAISAPNSTVTLSTTTGSLTLDAAVSASTINLSASSGGISGTGTVYGSTAVNVQAGATGVQGLNTSTPQLNIVSSGGVGGASNMLIFNTGSVKVSVSGSAFDEVALWNDLGSITTAGSMTNPGNVVLGTVGDNAYGIVLGGNIGNGTSSGGVNLEAGGSIVQSGTISASEITLSSTNGNIGVPTINSMQGITPNNATAILINLVNQSASGVGTLAVNAPKGTVYVINSSSANLSLLGSTSAGNFQTSTNGAFSVDGEVTSSAGSVYLANSSTTAGDMTVNADITAQGGPVIIQNMFSNNPPGTFGTIAISSNVTVQGNALNVIDTPSWIYGAAGVALLSGAFPNPLPSESTPANVNQTGSGQFNYSFGITAAIGPVTVNAAANTGVVMNCTDCTNSDSVITLGQNALISAAGVSYTISNLDLANTSTVSALNNAPVGSGVTSSLVGGASGATSGTVSFAAPFVLSGLQALNVPAGTAGNQVTVQFNTSPVIVNVQTGKNSQVNGIVQFASTDSMSVSSNVAGDVLKVGKTGSITTAGDLYLYTSGNMKIDGQVSSSANGLLALYTGGTTLPTKSGPTINPPGTITLTGTVSNGTAGNGGTIILGSNGSILQTAGNITANDVTLRIGGARNSFAASSISLISISADSVSVNAGTGAAVKALGKGSAVNVAELAVGIGNSTLTFSNSSAMSLSGNVTGSLLVLSPTLTTSGDVSCGSCTLVANTLRNSHSISTSNSAGTITFDSALPNDVIAIENDGGSIEANAGLSVGGTNGVTITGGSLSTVTGSLVILSPLGTVKLDGVSLSAGTLAGPDAGGVLMPTSIATSGTVQINGTLGISGTADATTAGGDLTLLSAKGSVALTNGYLEANGGRLMIGALNKVSANGTFFTADAVGTVATNQKGGSIEISSGVKALAPTDFSLSLPGLLPGNPVYAQTTGGILPLGSDMIISNYGNQSFGTGAVFATGIGQVNLTTSGTPSTLNLSGGNMLFGTVQSNSSIQMDGATMTVSGYTPIAFTSGAETVIEVATNAIANDSSIASILLPGQQGITVLSAAHADRNPKESGKPAKLTLKSGDVFLKALCPIVLHGAYGDVHIRKDALVAISIDGNSMRVISCNGVAAVRIVTAGRSINLGPGQEAIISDSDLSDQWIKADGIGRRALRTHEVSDGLYLGTCEVSLISMMLNLEHLQSLKNPRNAGERKLADELLHNAAAVETVTRGRGAYQARAARPAARWSAAAQHKRFEI